MAQPDAARSVDSFVIRSAVSHSAEHAFHEGGLNYGVSIEDELTADPAHEGLRASILTASQLVAFQTIPCGLTAILTGPL